MLSALSRRRNAARALPRSLGRRRGPLGATALVVVLSGCGPAGLYSRGTGSGGTTGAAGESPARDGGPGGSDAGGSGGILVGPGGAPGPEATGGEGGRPTGAAGKGGGGATGGTGIAGSGMSLGTGGGTAGAHGDGAGGSGARGGTAGAGSGGRGSGGGPGSGGAVGGAAGTGPAVGGSGGGGAGAAGSTGGLGSGGVAGPRIISIDFVGGAPGGASGTVVMDETEIAGIKPVSRWNSAAGAAGSLSALKVADGTVLAATFSWSSPVAGSAVGTWQVGYTDLPGDTRMMNGYLDPGDPGVPAIVRLSGLPAAFTTDAYDVYVYAASAVPNGTRTYDYAIGVSAFQVTQVGPTGTTFPGYILVPSNGGAGNCVVFKRLTGSSFTLTATPGTGPGTQTRAPVNGIQIVAPAGS